MKNRIISLVAMMAVLSFAAFAQKETKEEKKVRKSGITTKKKQAEMTPQQALQALKDGNVRFATGNPKNQQNLCETPTCVRYLAKSFKRKS